MPGFRIGQYGGNDSYANSNQRFYTSYSWELLALFINSDRSFNSNYGNVGSFSSTIMLRTCTLPQVTFEKVETKGTTVPYKFAGNPKLDDVRISWYDTQGLSNTIKQYINNIYDRELGVKAPIYYKRSTIIRKYLADRVGFDSSASVNNPDGFAPESVTYTLFGSWPLAYKESELTYLEASIKSIELTISYDDFQVQVSNQEDT